MVERDRDLNQSLQEFLFRFWSSTPNIFEHFVSFEEGSTIEQFYSPKIELRVHMLFWHTAYTIFRHGAPKGQISDVSHLAAKASV